MNIKSREQINLLSKYQLDFQIVEAMMINCGIMEPVFIQKFSESLRSNWELHRDPRNKKEELSIKSFKLNKTQLSQIPYCNKKNKFSWNVL